MVADLLDHDVVAGVLGGNAMSVYAALPRLPIGVTVGVTVGDPVEAVASQREEV